MSDANAVVVLSREEATAILTLNRPRALNAFGQDGVEGMLTALAEVRRDPAVRAVVLTGAGRAFCAGGDLHAARQADPDRPGDWLLDLAAVFHRCVLEIRRMAKPVVAAINGPAAGGGFSLALACDLRVMAESAFMQQAYTSNGLCIDGGGTFTLPRIVGLARALEIAFLDERIPSARALELGLVHRVVADGQVQGEARALAGRLARMPIGTLGRVKQLMNRSFEATLEAQLEDERHGIAESANAPEGREGLTAFVEKRAPDFLSVRA